ncbi:hypothetical protein CAP31_03650 [Sulfuriferula sp. AH1]|uniref:glycosyltransferase family 87 protein n=1 Tax=Sulfuriferula sp. AH1 TaxID=1985873 RepID=UPI000B3B614D|nr:glycosyltransferase family 87 protein [Sulfuriferula sp. AH1]ARU30859.1 hypothetical protein CAP31_03650 [Sulfuriferula sp. AH1]
MKISTTRISLLGWLLVLAGIYGLVIYYVSTYRSDFAVFYASLQFLLEGRDIYTPVPFNAFNLINTHHTGRLTLHPNLNPPFFTLLLSPLGWLPYQAAFTIWSLLSLGFGVIGALLLQRADNRQDTDYTLIVLILLFAYFPTLTNILIGQAALLIFMLVAGGWLAERRGQERLSGILLGLAFAIKLFMGLFLIYFLLQRRWRPAIWFMATAAASGLLGLAALGLDSYQNYIQALGSVTWQSSNWNASAYGFFGRIFGGSENIPLIDAPLLGKTLYYLLAATLVILLAWLLRRTQQLAPDVRADLGFSFTLVAALLISPLGWMYYFPLLLLPFFVLFRLAHTYQLTWKFNFPLLLTLLASSFSQLLTPAAENSQTAFTLSAYYFYALLGLGCLLIAANKILQGKHAAGTDTMTLERAHLLSAFLILVLYYAIIGAFFAITHKAGT